MVYEQAWAVPVLDPDAQTSNREEGGKQIPAQLGAHRCNHVEDGWRGSLTGFIEVSTWHSFPVELLTVLQF